MKSLGASLFPLLVVGFLAALTLWLDRTSQTDDTGRRASGRHDTDFYVEHFTVRRYASNGALQHTVTAEKMLHFPDDDTTTVTTPRLTYYQGQRTVVTAQTAWLDKEGKHVRLNDDVRIVRPGGPDSPETVITTSILFVTPDDEYAYTDAPVTITQGKSVVNGVGMEANNKTELAVLSGPVQGIIYQSEKK